MNCLVKNEKVLKQYLKIRNKTKSLIKKELNSEPVLMINTLELK